MKQSYFVIKTNIGHVCSSLRQDVSYTHSFPNASAHSTPR